MSRMQLLLTALFNTRYFYRSRTEELAYMLRTYKKLREDPNATYFSGSPELERVYTCAKRGEDLIIDCARAVITTDFRVKISEFESQGFVFIDSENPGRNMVFEENRKRIAMQKEKKESNTKYIPLPEFKPNDSYVEYIRALDREHVYVVPNTDISVVLAIAISIARPSVSLDISQIEGKYFNAIGSLLSLGDLMGCESVYIYTKDGAYEATKRSDGKFLCHDGKLRTIAELQNFGCVVPGMLGKIGLPKNDEPYRSILDNVDNQLQNYCGRATVKLRDVVQLR